MVGGWAHSSDELQPALGWGGRAPSCPCDFPLWGGRLAKASIHSWEATACNTVSALGSFKLLF